MMENYISADFFCGFGPCLQGFREGCRPYLSVDSTTLNGRWNGHLPSATSVDGHNWMFPVAFGFFDSLDKKYSTLHISLDKKYSTLDSLDKNYCVACTLVWIKNTVL
jgi:hypothetical protein